MGKTYGECNGLTNPLGISSYVYECGQSSPPNEQFLEISAGNFHTCGINTDGTVLCWGAGQSSNHCGAVTYGDTAFDIYEEVKFECGQSSPPNISFLNISAGHLHTCGITTDKNLECWGDNFKIKHTVFLVVWDITIKLYK